jgi:3-hydroxyacyl-CoA dehydrogenase
MTEFLENRVGRRVVVAKDTPGFIANRYGMWCMFHAIHVAERLRLSVEQVDAITGPFLGRPKSASFRLNDVVGLDVMKDIAANLLERCPNDPYIQALKPPNSLSALIAKNWIGEKSGQGYYRREGRELFVLDIGTLAYRQIGDIDLPSMDRLASLPLIERINAALELRDETGEFLRHYLLPALKYAEYLKEEVSHSVQDFDHVMEWGFGWQLGPFATLDSIGPVRSGVASVPFYQSGKYKTFEGSFTPIMGDPKYSALTDFQIVSETETYRLRDLGDGVTSVGLMTKMGVISPQAVIDLTKLLESTKLSRIVLTSEAKSFSAGFDLKFFSKWIAEERWIEIDHELSRLQKLGELLESYQAVSAIFGHALGGGLELALSTSKICALVETHIGLPEAKVGLLPGGRGTTLMRIYNQHTAKRLSEVAYNLATGAVSNNAEDARGLGYLRPTDETVFHPDRLFSTAKQAALNAKPVERPKVSTATGPLSGMIDRLLEVAISKGEISAHDELIGQKIKLIMSKATTYEDCLVKERTEFLDLCAKALTHARINHMLVNGTPLRN